MLTVVLIGPPASGKTTVADFLIDTMRFSDNGESARRVIDGVESVEQIETLRALSGQRVHVLGIEAPLADRRRWVRERAESDGKDPIEAEKEFERFDAKWDAALMDTAQAVIRTCDHHLFTIQVAAVVQSWIDIKPRTLFAEMVEAVAEFHRKNGFPVGNGDRDTLYRHQALLSEELGEISAALTKGKGDLTEEYADLLVLALGSAVAMNWDLEEVFWRKIDKIMARESRVVGGEVRVSAWGAAEKGTLRQLARLRSLRRILHPDAPDQLEFGEDSGQTELNLGM